MSINTKIHDKLIKDYWIQKIIDNESTYIINALHADKKKKRRKVKSLIDAEIQHKIESISGGNETTTFVIYLSFFTQLLFRYLHAEQLLIATPSLILPVEADASSLRSGDLFFKLKNDNSLTVKEQLGKTKSEVEDSINHAGLEVEELKNYIQQKGMDVQKSLFQFGCSYDCVNTSMVGMEQVDFGLRVMKTKGGLTFEITYNNNLFEHKFIKQFLEHLHNLIALSLDKLDTLQCDISFLSAEDEKKLIDKHNRSVRKYPVDRSIHRLFEMQVAKTPNATALVYGTEKLTYKQLNSKANSLAHYLMGEAGIVSGDSVALLVDRSSEWIISLLAILKTGAAYVPLDRTYPKERLQFMLNDVQPKILLLNSDDMFDFDYYDGQFFALDIQMDVLHESSENTNIDGSGDYLAYIMYTSGSTGRPKGVMVSHKNVVRLVKNTNFIKVKPEDRLLVTGAPVFDATTFEVWGMLLNGASLHLLGEEQLLTPRALKSAIEQHKITTIWLTTSWFNQLIDYDMSLFKTLQHIIFGGEKSSLKHINKIHEAFPDLKLTNGYGPTENTTFSLFHQVDRLYEEAVPIGKPIANSTAYILDENMRLQPFGVTGEIYVGGDGVAMGYLNAPELTQERFVPNPFGFGYLYKTGDLGIRQFDGTILFGKRNDKQVKIRGYRIELEEVEKVLKQHEAIKDVIVLTYQESDETYSLVTYFIKNKEVDTDEISHYCSEKLPQYMCPSYFMNIAVMPLTVNGKLDKKQLPLPGGLMQGDQAYIAANTVTEKALATIWKQVLGKEQISILDNFFKIGGHSLRATMVISRVHEELGVNADLKDLFLTPTIKEFAQVLDKAEKKAYRAIVPVPEQELYEVSYAQHRLWVLDQFEESQVAYSMPLTYQLMQVDEEAIERAIYTVVDRHESLRTTFIEKEGKVFQKIKKLDESDFQLVKIDVSEYPDTSSEASKHIYNAIQTPFDLKNGPLVKAYLIHQSKDVCTLLFNMHHIISDGWSIKVLLFEAITLYQAYVNGEENPLPPLSIQYKDYAAWQKQELSGKKIKTHKEYWHGLLKGELPVLHLPTDYTRPPIKTYNGQTIGTMIGEKLTLGLNALAQKNRASLFMTLIAAIKTLLYRYTSQEDIIVGSTIAGRDHKDLEDQIGFYVNTLTLRSKIEGDKSFDYLLQTVKENIVNAYEHQVYPFDKLVNDLDLIRDPSRSPIFDVMVNLLNIDGPSPDIDQSQGGSSDGKEVVAASIQENDLGVSKFDLTFVFTEVGQNLSFYIEYNTDLFAKERIERMLGHIQVLFNQICTDSQQTIGEIFYLMEKEKDQLLNSFNNTRVIHPKKKVYEFLKNQSLKLPENRAVISGKSVLSYGDFDRLSDGVAAFLIEKYSIKANDRIGLIMSRSVQLPVMLMGILKSGASYVPIDPEYPENRIHFIIKDANLKVIITESEWSHHIPMHTSKLILEEENFELLPIGDIPICKNKISDVAYIIYTSGSTGRPKGVAISHGALTNFLMSMKYQLGIGSEDILLALTTFSFDISILEIFLPLLSGGTVLLADNRTTKDPNLLMSLIRSYNPTVIQATPSLWRILLDSGWEGNQNLKALCGGEALSKSLGMELLGKTGELWNMYGPTETTIYSLIKPIVSEKDLDSIGKPIDNTEVYVLDDNNQLVPLGVDGELHIGGEGLSIGYLNKPDLTYKQFIENPFRPFTSIYKTGDQVRWLDNGEIKFLGRKDNQVKVRGYRIELGEIEAALEQHISLDKAIVIIEEKNDTKQIVAFVIGSKIKETDLQEHLGKLLPFYMQPSYFVTLDEIPLTPNGKTDKKSLLKKLITVEQLSQKKLYVAPKNEIEKALVKIWQNIFNKQRVCVQDNFFMIGGDSIKAMQVVSYVYKEIGVKISLGQVFTYPTINLLADEIEKQSYQGYEEIPQIEPAEFYAVSAGQKRLWMIDKSGEANYNMSSSHEILGELTLSLVESIFNKLLDRHEILRTTFKLHQGEVVQVVHENLVDFKVDYRDWTDNNDWETQLTAILQAEAIDKFDLENGPLFRCRLIRLDESRHICLLTMHHIISDGWSFDLMFKELGLLYEAYLKNEKAVLPPLRIQYKDFSAWQQAMLQTDRVNKPKKYWKEVFNGELPLLKLPSAHPRPKTKTYNGACISHFVEATVINELRSLSKEKSCSLFITLFSAFKMLLYRYTGQQDIILGTVEAGRQHPDLENQLGFYVNTMAIRTRFKANDTFDIFLGRVKQSVLGAYQNMFYPFDTIVDDLDLKWDRSHSPLFDVVFSLTSRDMTDTYQQKDIPSDNSNLENITIGGYRSEVVSSMFDIVMNVKESHLGLEIHLFYNTDIFDERQMQLLLQRYQKILNAIIIDKNKKINSFEFDDKNETSVVENQLNSSLDYDFNF